MAAQKNAATQPKQGQPAGKSGGLSLTTVFVAAATAVITGIPTDFISEMFIFPFYHNSTLGTEIVNWSSGILLPFYEAVGEFFGVPSMLNVAAPGVPSIEF